MRTAKACDVAFYGAMILMVIDFNAGGQFLAFLWMLVALVNGVAMIFDLFDQHRA